MPAIDVETNELILRIAYDGASRAGKTTNLNQLSQKLDSEIVAPEQVGERTIYFDWMRYRAGNFEGRPIRCELLSAPGQELLAQRRDLLLSTADAIVMVVDASDYQLAHIAKRVTELRASSDCNTPPSVLVQANKCDIATQEALDEIREYCKSHNPPLMLTQATATEGRGVRETFVLAVRLAVVRAHALRRSGLIFPEAQTMDAETMLKWLRTQESLNKANLRTDPPTPPATISETEAQPAASLPSAAKQPPTAPRRAKASPPAPPKRSPEQELDTIERTINALRKPSANPYALLSEGEQGQARLPDPPRPDVPEGMVWPPVTGRAALQDISAQDIQVEAIKNGGFYASIKDCWELHSAADAVFHSPVKGMEQLLAWAKQHSQLSEVLSGPRCIVFSPVDNRQAKTNHAWRLWQIVRVHRPVRDRIAGLLDEDNPVIIADSLISAGACILQVEALRAKHSLLPECTLESVGERLNGAHYVGLLPGPRSLANNPQIQRPSPKDVLSRELSEVVLQDWRDNGYKITREIRALARDFEDPKKKLAAQTLSDVLNEHRLKASPIRLWSRALIRR